MEIDTHVCVCACACTYIRVDVYAFERVNTFVTMYTLLCSSTHIRICAPLFSYVGIWMCRKFHERLCTCVYVRIEEKKDQASQTPGENCSFIRWSQLRDGLDPTIVLKNTIDRFWVSYCWYNRIDPSIEIDWPQRKETFIHLRLIDHKRINTPYLESGRMNGLIGTIFFWGESPRRTVDVDLVSL